MIENDLPQGTLKESKYQKSKKTLKTVGICLVIAGIVASGAIAAATLASDNAEKTSGKTAYDQLLEKERTAFAEKQETAKANAASAKSDADALIAKIDAEKQAILAGYDTLPFTSITAAQSIALSKVNQKYRAEIDAMTQKVGALGLSGVKFECSSVTSRCEIRDPFGNLAEANNIKEFNPNTDGSYELIQAKMDSTMTNAKTDQPILAVIIKSALPLFLLSGTGGVLLLLAHKREVAAFGAQAMLPVASEATGKMVKSLDDNGTLDIIAKTGAKMTGRSVRHLRDDGTLDIIAETGAKIMGNSHANRPKKRGVTKKSDK